MVSSIENNFYAAFFRYLNDVCYQNGYSVFFTSSELDLDRERRNLEFFLNRSADAVIITRSLHQHDDLIQRISDQGIPVILDGEMGPTRFPLVTIDEFKVGELAAAHLWSLGHRIILYFTAEKTTNERRLVHFFRRQNFLVPWNRISGDRPIRNFQTADPTHGGNELAEYLTAMTPPDRPTAIVCSTDRLALSLVAGLRTHRIGVPEDISILGCDDISEAETAAVPLTTIRLPVEKMAQAIWTVLEKKLHVAPGAMREESQTAIYIEPELIVRESTRAIAASSSP